MLVFKNFTIFSKDRIVLSVPELSLFPGTFTYFLGENSSGKTIFLKTLCGEYKETKGEVIFKEDKLKHHWKENNIILINNDLHVIEKDTFLENVEIPLGRINSVQKNRLLDMASLVNIVHLFKQKMLYCSRSDKMLMYIVRTALISPSLLLIDDFDTFFDQDKLLNVINLFHYFQKSGTMIIATGKSALDFVTTYRLWHGDIVKVVEQ